MHSDTYNNIIAILYNVCMQIHDIVHTRGAQLRMVAIAMALCIHGCYSNGIVHTWLL